MSDCIEWAGHKDRNGYGKTRYLGKPALAHRAAWMMGRGPIPAGIMVLHRCDNRACCNLAHLFLGTQNDNMKDAKAKGRISHVSRNCGTAHGASKITEQTAIRLKVLHKSVPARVLAKALGLNAAWVGAIMRSDQWKHVTAEMRYVF